MASSSGLPAHEYPQFLRVYLLPATSVSYLTQPIARKAEPPPPVGALPSFREQELSDVGGGQARAGCLPLCPPYLGSLTDEI